MLFFLLIVEGRNVYFLSQSLIIEQVLFILNIVSLFNSIQWSHMLHIWDHPGPHCKYQVSPGQLWKYQASSECQPQCPLQGSENSQQVWNLDMRVTRNSPLRTSLCQFLCSSPAVSFCKNSSVYTHTKQRQVSELGRPFNFEGPKCDWYESFLSWLYALPNGR